MNWAKGTSRAWRPLTLRGATAGLVLVNVTDSKKLMRNLVTLVRNSRTFVHRARPLYWEEVRRFRRLGRRCLARVYGDASSETETFRQLTERAFYFLPTRSDHIHKVDVIEGCEVTVVGDEEDRVYNLNKFELNEALRVLIEAAHRLRGDKKDKRVGSVSSARQAFVTPLLKAEGWSVLDWALESKVDFHTANDYLKGATKPYRLTRKKLAAALGVAVENLPD